MVVDGKEIVLPKGAWELADHLRKRGDHWTDSRELVVHIPYHTKALKFLRKALGETASRPRFVQAERISGSRTYRFRMVSIEKLVGRKAPQEKQLGGDALAELSSAPKEEAGEARKNRKPSSGGGAENQAYTPELQLVPEETSVAAEGYKVSLSALEWELLEALAQRPEKWFGSGDLAAGIYGSKDAAEQIQELADRLHRALAPLMRGRQIIQFRPGADGAGVSFRLLVKVK